MRGFFILVACVLLLVPTALAQTAQLSIQDELLENKGVVETITIQLEGNADSSLSIDLPSGAQNVQLDGAAAAVQNNALLVPLSCASCSFSISYELQKVVREQNEQYLFYRTLEAPVVVSQLTYKVVLPPGAVINQASQEPSLVPAASSIRTDGEHIIVEWAEQNPQLPKIYQIQYAEAEHINGAAESREWLGAAALFVVSALLGFSAGWLLRQRKEVPAPRVVVSASLLSPDEKKLIAILSGEKAAQGQKELGRQLGWSKSKTSAILTGLEYKKMVRREKIGRNYTVELVRAVEAEEPKSI